MMRERERFEVETDRAGELPMPFSVSLLLVFARNERLHLAWAVIFLFSFALLLPILAVG